MEKSLFRKAKVKPIVKTLSLLSMTLLMSFCKGQTLDKETALEVVKKEYTKDVCKKGIKRSITTLYDADYNDMARNYYELEKMGLVRVTVEKHPKNRQAMRIVSTPKAEAEFDFSSTVNVLVFVPTEVIGISVNEGSHTAEVIFLGKYDPTPFFYIAYEDDRCQIVENVEKRATLIHYDSGWRLKDVR